MQWQSVTIDSTTTYSFNIASSNPDLPTWLTDFVSTDGYMDLIAETGANTVTLHLNYVLDTTSDTVNPSDITPTWSNTENAAQLAVAHNLAPVFYATITLPNWGGSQLYPGYVPSNADAWFASYRSLILEEARLSAKYNAPYLPIGVELGPVATDPAYLPKWTSLIAEVRAIYHGPLTYNSYVNEFFESELPNVTFKNQIDYLGINFYPKILMGPGGEPVTNGTLADFNAAWTVGYNGQPPLETSLRSFIQSLNMPVYISELGIERIDGAGSVGFVGEQPDTPLDLQEQADAYNATLSAIYHSLSDVINGVNIWGSNDVGIFGSDGNFTRHSTHDLNFLLYPAQGIVRTFFDALESSPLATLTTPAQLMTELYVGYYNRAPDPAGLQYWISNYTTPGGPFYQDIGHSSAAFADPNQAETIALYPFLANPQTASYTDVVHFVTDAYHNLFGRTVDGTDQGARYWATSISKSLGIAVPTFGDPVIDHTGPVPAANALIALIFGAQGNDAATIANKVAVGLYYETELAANNVAFTQASAHNAFAGVISDFASVISAEVNVNAFIASPTTATSASLPAVLVVGVADTSLQTLQASHLISP